MSYYYSGNGDVQVRALYVLSLANAAKCSLNGSAIVDSGKVAVTPSKAR